MRRMMPEHRCLAAEDVIRAIEVYFAGGAIDHPTEDEVRSIAELLGCIANAPSA